jgi:cbb3-type cytochrome oxidase subunit 3
MALTMFAEALRPIALLAGVAVFVGLVVYVFWPRRKREVEAHGQIPFKED